MDEKPKRRLFALFLLIVCAGIYGFINWLWLGESEDLKVLQLFILLYFPVLPITFLSQIFALAAKHPKRVDVPAVILDVLAAVFIMGFWFLLVLNGGSGNMHKALIVAAINITVPALLLIKIATYSKDKELKKGSLGASITAMIFTILMPVTILVLNVYPELSPYSSESKKLKLISLLALIVEFIIAFSFNNRALRKDRSNKLAKAVRIILTVFLILGIITGVLTIIYMLRR